MSYSLYILKTVKRQCVDTLAECTKGSGKALRLDPLFRDGLCFLIFYLHFILKF